jgi:hypothetical protein
MKLALMVATAASLARPALADDVALWTEGPAYVSLELKWSSARWPLLSTVIRVAKFFGPETGGVPGRSRDLLCERHTDRKA